MTVTVPVVMAANRKVTTFTMSTFMTVQSRPYLIMLVQKKTNAVTTVMIMLTVTTPTGTLPPACLMAVSASASLCNL